MEKKLEKSMETFLFFFMLANSDYIAFSSNATSKKASNPKPILKNS